MKPAIFRPAAAADVEDAYRWYEDQRPGLGEEFVGAVSTVIEFLVAYTERSLLFTVRHVVQICGGFHTAFSTELLTIR